MSDVLALTWFGESILVAVVLAVYAAVIWMIVDILRRPDFSGVEKVLWIIAGIVFSIATLLVYVLWVRKKDCGVGDRDGGEHVGRHDGSHGATGGSPGTGSTADDACAQLGVDPGNGLDADEVGRRRAQVGPNRLAEAESEPGWQAFLRQYRDLMQLVLVGAAVVSIAALQELSTGIVILALTVVNALPRPEPGGQGGGERRRAPEDARDQRARASRRKAHRRPRGRARAGRRRRLRGGRQDPGRRPSPRGRDPRDRGVRADRGERAGAEGGRRRHGRRRPARRPPRHGVHELDRHPRPRRDGRHRDGDVDRGRTDLRGC